MKSKVFDVVTIGIFLCLVTQFETVICQTCSNESLVFSKDGATVAEFTNSGLFIMTPHMQGLPCDNSLEGAMRFNSTTKRFEGCDGVEWNCLSCSVEDRISALENENLDTRLTVLESNNLNSRTTSLENTVNGLVTRVSELESSTIGTILPFGGSANETPDKWLYCNGTEISRTEYNDLFSIIGTSFGIGDGSTTFNLPDLRGRFLRGVDDGNGLDTDAPSRTSLNGGASGDVVGSIQDDEFKSHSHPISDPGHSHSFAFNTVNLSISSGAFARAQSGSSINTSTNNEFTGITIDAVGGSETRPKNINVLYIIKASS